MINSYTSNNISKEVKEKICSLEAENQTLNGEKKILESENKILKEERKILENEKQILEEEKKILHKKLNSKYISSLKFALLVTFIASVYTLSKYGHKIFNTSKKQNNIIRRTTLHETSENLWGAAEKENIRLNEVTDVEPNPYNNQYNHSI